MRVDLWSRLSLKMLADVGGFAREPWRGVTDGRGALHDALPQHLEATWAFVTRRREFDCQEGNDQFGSLTENSNIFDSSTEHLVGRMNLNDTIS